MPQPKRHDSHKPIEKIKKEYIRGDLSLPMLCKKYGMSESNLYRYSGPEKWGEQRRTWRDNVSARSADVVMAKQVQDHVRVYDATRRIVDKFVAQAERFADDADGLFRHLVQEEDSVQEGTYRKTQKRVEERSYAMINGKNLADVAKGLRDLSIIARTLDGILDAKDAAKTDIERERLVLDRQKIGLDNDIESESGIAVMPPVDMSLLDGALPDPGEPILAIGDNA